MIDAPTLLHITDAIARLQADALVTVDPRLAAIAKDVVAVAAIDVLLNQTPKR